MPPRETDWLTRTAPIVARSAPRLYRAVNDAGTSSAIGELHTRLNSTWVSRRVVVASNCSSILEVVGDAGLLFNPRATGDLADILLFLLDSPTERDRLIAKGHQRSQMFSWDKTVAQTVDVYCSVSN